nr:MAG TPA: hypothetical protein [Caudoviricetes sp.]
MKILLISKTFKKKIKLPNKSSDVWYTLGECLID